MLQPIHLADQRPIPYATAIDFCRTFTEELQSLYLLSLLLTADNDKAEECLVSAMGECGDGPVFSWNGLLHGPCARFSSMQSR
jgi:hypothetical protein